MNLTVYNSISDLNNQVCTKIVALANSCIRDNDYFNIALAGGSTPKQLYQTLAKKSASLDWSKTFVYFGDERYLPHSNPASNYHMINEYLLQHIPIPKQNIFPVDTSFDNPSDAAQNYESTIRNRFKSIENKPPCFDLILLGIGEDGHTASIFPESETITEENRLVINAYHQQSKTDRITFTLPLINSANSIFIIATGDNKKSILRKIQNLEDQNIKKYPIQLVHALNDLHWFIDKSASSNPPY